MLRLGDEDALPQKLKSWLKRRGNFIPLPGHTFTTPNGAQHHWVPVSHANGFGALIMFQLFNKKDMNTPIATLQTPNASQGRASHELILEDEAMEMLDTVIISLVITLAEKFLMEVTFMNQASNTYEINRKLFSKSRSNGSSTKSFSRHSRSASDDADNASLYASSTTGLIRASGRECPI